VRGSGIVIRQNALGVCEDDSIIHICKQQGQQAGYIEDIAAIVGGFAARRRARANGTRDGGANGPGAT
jgi:hypothetical protein